MNWSNIICIEVKKYNSQQLDVICEQLNLQPGTLAVFKESGSTLLYWEKDKSYVICSVKKEALRDSFSKPLYKGLYLNSNYNHLSQKEKDRLLKIQPTDFRTKKNTKVFTESKSSNKKLSNILNEVLETDAILDKIFKSGMNSLTSNEKKFLDDLSKS
jgi:hypothetical protein